MSETFVVSNMQLDDDHYCVVDVDNDVDDDVDDDVDVLQMICRDRV